MCQLLGISANKPVNLNFSFKAWRHRGCSNPHGYGFAYWHRGTPHIVKEPRSLWKKAQKEGNPVQSVRSSMFVCHVRFASAGPPDGSNTHPFDAELHGRHLVFAHNGTLSRLGELPLHRLKPGGDTDSEHAFLWMLERLHEVPPERFAPALKELADRVRSLGRFNFLLSDGQTLWAYADDALHLIERKPPFGGRLVTALDDGYTIDLAEVKAPDERAVLVATEPLTDEPGWTRLGRGELAVIKDGAASQRLS